MTQRQLVLHQGTRTYEWVSRSVSLHIYGYVGSSISGYKELVVRLADTHRFLYHPQASYAIPSVQRSHHCRGGRNGLARQHQRKEWCVQTAFIGREPLNEWYLCMRSAARGCDDQVTWWGVPSSDSPVREDNLGGGPKPGEVRLIFHPSFVVGV